MAVDRTWADSIYEYNSSSSQDYEYITGDGEDYVDGSNLRYCPKCNHVFEKRYEQQVNQIICYIYTEICRWTVTGTLNPDYRNEDCGSQGCCGDTYAIRY